MAVGKRVLFYTSLVISISLLLYSFAFATIINVPANQTTIQAGINAAVNGDTVLVADGTYFGTGNKGLKYNGKAITILSENGPETSIIDCQNSGRAFSCREGETTASILDGFTIINGNASHGGAIEINLGASLTIRNCIMRNCSAQFGGAIFSDNNSWYNISNCQFFDNSASSSGGAIGIHNSGIHIFNLMSCLIVGNSAPNGGGIYLVNSRGYIRNCTLSKNAATGTGGAIQGANGNTFILECIIAFNNNGGSIGCEGSGSVVSCTDIFGNNEGDWVGCIANQASINNNFSSDPQFCDTAAENYLIELSSPCAPYNNPCLKLIGAMPICCSDTSDVDSDGFGDCSDNCPFDHNPQQFDSDFDQIGDVCDYCPFDAWNDIDKDGVCGDIDNCPNFYNPPQDDFDLDGKGDQCDNCPFLPNANQADVDLDGSGDNCDNCVDIFNSSQIDSDGDAAGDACDICPAFDDRIDVDGDGIPNGCDICEGFDDHIDTDFDGDPNGCDNCPAIYNSSQNDFDLDGIGDVCDFCIFDSLNDPDLDSICGAIDNCPFEFNPGQQDLDGDGIGNDCDNCPMIANQNQADEDDDGIGDACCCIFDRGDINYDGTDANIIDLTYMVDRIFRGGPMPGCPKEADVNSDGTSANILDLTFLVDRIFRGGPRQGRVFSLCAADAPVCRRQNRILPHYDFPTKSLQNTPRLLYMMESISMSASEKSAGFGRPQLAVGLVNLNSYKKNLTEEYQKIKMLKYHKTNPISCVFRRISRGHDKKKLPDNVSSQHVLARDCFVARSRFRGIRSSQRQTCGAFGCPRLTAQKIT